MPGILNQLYGFSPVEDDTELRSEPLGGVTHIPDLEAHILQTLGLEHIKIKANSRAAMALPTFYSAVELISDLIAAQPASVFFKDEKGVKSGKSHPLNYLIKTRPNRQMSSFIFRKVMIMNMKVHGYSIAQVTRDRLGRPTALIPYPTKDVQLYRDPETQFCFFRITNKPGLVLTEDDVIFLKDSAFDGGVGHSVVHWQQQAIELPSVTRAFAMKNLEKGAFIAGFITAPLPAGKGGEEAADLYKSRVVESLKGTKFGGFGLAVLGQGADYKPVTRSIVESEVIKILEQSDEDIAKIFRVPLVMLGDTRKSTSFGKGIDSMYILLTNNVLIPIARQFELEVDYKCFTHKELTEEEYFTRINMRGLLRGDAAAYAEYVTKLIDRGVYNQNEVRDWDELAPFDGGDTHWIQQNMMPIDMAEEILKSKNNGSGNQESDKQSDGKTSAESDDSSEN